MMNPIDRLLGEHRSLLSGIAVFGGAIAAVRKEGASALPPQRDTLARGIRLLETDLIAHATRENEGLFPALEEIFGVDWPPIRAMRREHEEIHVRVKALSNSVRKTLDATGPDQAATAQAMCIQAQAALALIDAHFQKEEGVLFPTAREVLGRDALLLVSERMEEARTPF